MLEIALNSYTRRALLAQAASGSAKKRPRANSQEMCRRSTLWTNPFPWPPILSDPASPAAKVLRARFLHVSLNEIVPHAFAQVAMASIQATPFGVRWLRPNGETQIPDDVTADATKHPDLPNRRSSAPMRAVSAEQGLVDGGRKRHPIARSPKAASDW